MAKEKAMICIGIVLVLAFSTLASTLIKLPQAVGTDDEDELAGVLSNIAPVCTMSSSDLVTSIAGTLAFSSGATDADGYISYYGWAFGDGTSAGGSVAHNITHAYAWGGSYLVYHNVTDNGGADASNERSMARVIVSYYDPADTWEWDNNTHPFAVMVADHDHIERNSTVLFDMSGSYGVGGWNWVDPIYHWAGQNQYSGVINISSATIDYGDGTGTNPVAPGSTILAAHKYVSPGHYAAKFTVNSLLTTPYVENKPVSTTVIRTIHVSATNVSSEVKNPGTFIKATIGEPDYLDPAVDYETAGGEVIQNVYETLVWYDGDSAKNLVPLLATAIPTIANGGISADGLNYTFHLRSNVKFHTGETMTADDVVYSVQRVLRIHDPSGPSWMVEQVMSDYISYYVGSTIKSWKESTTHTIPAWLLGAVADHTNQNHVITEADVTSAAEAAAYKVDANTVTFRLTHPYPGFIYICAYTVMSVVSKTYVQAHGGITNGDLNTYMDDHACGTGPYQMVGWTKGSNIHLTKNANYWNSASFKTDSINDIYIVRATNEDTRTLMLQSGDADSADIPLDYRPLFTGSSYSIDMGKPSFETIFLGFNRNINATAGAAFGSTVPSDFFADIHVRKAFTHLMNYDQFIANALRGNALRLNGPIPCGMFGYDAGVPNYSYNLRLAEHEFKLAVNPATGNPWWTDGFTIAFMFNAGNEVRETACAYLKMALEGLNPLFHATINPLDWPTYLRLQRSNPSPLPIFWLGWAPDYADPDDYCTPFLDSVYGTYAAKIGYENASLDALIRQAAGELNTSIRLGLYSQITRGTYDDAPYLWLYQSCNFHVERSWISGYYYNPMHNGLYYLALTKGESNATLGSGLLRVATSPACPSMIYIDGNWASRWGLDWVRLSVGTHTLSFGDVVGMVKPAPMNITIAADQVTTVEALFTPMGALRVMTSPALPSTIYVDGIPRNDWGFWNYVPAGTYTVSFGPVAGFDDPAPQTVTVAGGGSTAVTGAFVANPSAPGPDPATYGMLRVTTNPAVPSMISLDGNWMTHWGIDWVKLSPGTYELTVSDVQNVLTPASQSVTIVAGETTTVDLIFPLAGVLRVITSPALPSTIFVDGIPRNDWGIWTDVAPGIYVVSFGPVPGFVSPGPQIVTVTANEYTEVTGFFVPI